ncbi:MAG: long-chain fatty acid--CoA ligase [Peptococcaceae bacterium]|nr:long-chain fatty acid--CoA ligase [Peptococcaceae bacterium]
MLDKILRETAKKNPDKIAIYFADQKIPYAQLDQEVDNLASALLKSGLEFQGRVGIILGNGPNFIRSYFAVLRAGGVAVLLNPASKGEEFKYYFEDSGIKHIITSVDTLPVITGILDQVPPIKQIIVAGGSNEGQYASLEDILSTNAPPVEIKISENDVATCLYTSGTTGKPKGALLTHKNFTFSVAGCVSRMEMVESDHCLCVIPLYHIFSLYVNAFSPIAVGASVTILEHFNPAVVLREIESKKITVFCAVPGMYIAMLQMLANQESDISSLRLCISGGAPLPREVYDAYLEKYNIVLIEGSGPTEAPTFIGGPKYHKLGSVGCPIEGVSIKIVDSNDREVPMGELGEVCIKGPNVMLGYQNQPEATAEVIIDGWFHTGDIGRIDEDGFVYLVDRKKDMILVGGLNVYPREVEECLYKHPDVYEAAVVGIPDKERGQIPKAFIVLKPGAKAEAKDFILFCRKYLSNYKCPREVAFVDSLPKTATGKIDKTQLK